MAERRMFAKTIIDSDAFLDMPLSTQSLYFHLSMRADDDGFINNPKKIQRMIGCSDDDLKLLIAKRFILPFDSGVVVIKHWKIHNYIQKDRYKETVYHEEKAMLTTKDNGAYTLDTECIHNGYSLETQVSIGKSKAIDNNIYGDSEESIDDFFDRIWKLYPRKQGKGSVSKTQKKKLQRIGYDELKRCVERYCDYISENNISPKYIKQGSTFFNSGYVDFLDENYFEDLPMPVSGEVGGRE